MKNLVIMNQRTIRIFLFTWLAASIFLNCNTTKTTTQEMTDDEKAAQLLIDQMPQEGFRPATYIIGHSDVIDIKYKKDNSIGGQIIITQLTYNLKTKKWNAGVEKKDMRAGTSKNLENLAPKSGWFPLMQKLSEQQFLTIRNADEMGYEKVIADGNGYSLEIRIEEHYRRYGHTNPVIYSETYPEFEDLKAFTRVVDIFESEFDLTFD